MQPQRMWEGTQFGGSLEALPPILATSSCATLLANLPSRLVALCNRQCLASGLSSVEQEDALRLFTLMLRRSREPAPCVGIIFSSTPQRAVPSTPSSPRRAREAETPREDACSTPVGSQSLDTGGVPGLAVFAETSAALRQVLGDPSSSASGGLAHACTGRLYELLSHLSDVRSLVSTLLPAEEVATDPEVCEAAAVVEQHSSLARALSSDDLRLMDDLDEEGTVDTMAPPISLPDADALGSSIHDDLIVEKASKTMGMEDIMPDPPFLTHVDVVSQILLGIDRIVEMCEGVLKDVNSEFGAIMLQMHAVTHDREIWAHRLLAAKELQRSGALCSEINRIDEGSGDM